jgi:hypothetical protein
MADRLVAFLHVLMRDHVPPGVVESLMVEHAEKTIGPYQKDAYTNKHLAKYAVEISKRLVKRNTKPSVKKEEAARRAGKLKLEKRKRLPDSSGSPEIN